MSLSSLGLPTSSGVRHHDFSDGMASWTLHVVGYANWINHLREEDAASREQSAALALAITCLPTRDESMAEVRAELETPCAP